MKIFRIIPTDRQNLGMVLRENGLKEYDSLRLLMKVSALSLTIVLHMHIAKCNAGFGEPQ